MNSSRRVSRKTRPKETKKSLKTYKTYTKEGLAKLQAEDNSISGVLAWMAKGHKPTFRLIDKEPPVARKLLHEWDKLLSKDGIL